MESIVMKSSMFQWSDLLTKEEDGNQENKKSRLKVMAGEMYQKKKSQSLLPEQIVKLER